MATLIIRDVDDELHARLIAQAAAHQRSMEEEVRILLQRGITDPPVKSQQGFGQAMRAIFEPLGGLELPDVRRDSPRDPPDLSRQTWDPRACAVRRNISYC